MHVNFQKKKAKNGKNTLKQGKILKNLGKNVQNSKIFLKRAGDCMQLLHVINW